MNTLRRLVSRFRHGAEIDAAMDRHPAGKRLEPLIKDRIRHRDGSKISDREARGLARLAELNHEMQSTPWPTVVVLPGGFTCLRCEENPALPDRIWCAVCAPIIDALPAEPIERGGLR